MRQLVPCEIRFRVNEQLNNVIEKTIFPSLSPISQSSECEMSDALNGLQISPKISSYSLKAVINQNE
jgi:hypothetical protein